MKKVLNVIILMEPGGVQQRERMFRPYLTSGGYDFKSVFLYKKIDDGLKDSIYLFHKKPNLFQFPIIFFKLVKIFLTYRPHVLIAWGWTANSFSTIASLVTPKCKKIVMQSSTAYEYKMVDGKYQRLIASIGTFADKFLGSIGLYDLNIMISNHDQKSFSKYPKSYLKNCKLINNGVGLETPTDADIQFINEKLSLIPKGKKLIGSVGRLTNIKNQSLIVNALQYLPDVFYAIVGQGPFKDNLINDAIKFNVDDRLLLIGSLRPSEITAFLKRLDLFVFPSLSEAFGLAVVEAASVPLPIVTIDAPWVYDTLEDACIKSENDPKRFAANIEKVLNNALLYNELKEKSLNLAKKYAYSTMANNYIKEIQRLLS